MTPPSPSAAMMIRQVAVHQVDSPLLATVAQRLDALAAFNGLPLCDARHLAMAITLDCNTFERPSEALQQRIRGLLRGDDGMTWTDADAVYRALQIARQVVADVECSYPHLPQVDG